MATTDAEVNRLNDLLARTREQKHSLLRAATEAIQIRQDIEDDNKRLKDSIEELCMKSADKVQKLQQELAVKNREIQRLREDKKRAETRLVAEEQRAARAETQFQLLSARISETSFREPAWRGDETTTRTPEHFTIQKNYHNNDEGISSINGKFDILRDINDEHLRSVSPAQTQIRSTSSSNNQFQEHSSTSPPTSLRDNDINILNSKFAQNHQGKQQVTTSIPMSSHEPNNDLWKFKNESANDDNKNNNSINQHNSPYSRNGVSSISRIPQTVSPIATFNLKLELEKQFPNQMKLREEILEIQHNAKLASLGSNMVLPHSIFIGERGLGQEECGNLLGKYLTSQLHVLYSGHVVDLELSQILKFNQIKRNEMFKALCSRASEGVLLVHDITLLLDNFSLDGGLDEASCSFITQELIATMSSNVFVILMVPEPMKLVKFVETYSSVVDLINYVIHFQ